MEQNYIFYILQPTTKKAAAQPEVAAAAAAGATAAAAAAKCSRKDLLDVIRHNSYNTFLFAPIHFYFFYIFFVSNPSSSLSSSWKPSYIERYLRVSQCLRMCAMDWLC